jgi:hypothetical protein
MPIIRNNGFIYCLQEREFVKDDLGIYKIGYTENLQIRMNGYPKSSVLYFVTFCNHPRLAESELLELFRKLYIPRPEFGDEYFQGNIHDMLRTLGSYFYCTHFKIMNQEA